MLDAHCHLDAFPDIEEIIKRSGQKLSAIITCGYSVETSQKAVDIARRYSDFVFPIVGVAPQTAMKMRSKDWKMEIPENAIAIGEIGLDFHWARTEEEKNLQRECFTFFLKIADEIGLPVVIHSRDSYDEVLSTLDMYALKGVMLHCFSGKLEHAKIAEQRRYTISLPPIPSKTRKDAITKTNVAYVVESDSPYIGKTPLDTIIAAEFASKARMKSLEDIDKETTNTAMKLFKLKI